MSRSQLEEAPTSPTWNNLNIKTNNDSKRLYPLNKIGIYESNVVKMNA